MHHSPWRFHDTEKSTWNKCQCLDWRGKSSPNPWICPTSQEGVLLNIKQSHADLMESPPRWVMKWEWEVQVVGLEKFHGINEPHPYTCVRHRQSLSDATALLVGGMHCEHWIELLPTPQQQAPQGCLPDSLKTSWPTPETRNLVFFMLTPGPLFSMPAFHALGLEIRSCWVSTMSTRSSV